MAVPLEERQKPLPYLDSPHRRWSLGVGRLSPSLDPTDNDESQQKRGRHLNGSRRVERTRLSELFPAISVQFWKEAAGRLQLSDAKLCIACACMRLARIYADDAG